MKWIHSVPADSLYLSSITILELEIGVLLLERRDPFQGEIFRSWMNTHVLPSFSNQIIDFDANIAKCCAKLHVPNPRPAHDAIIAATALAHSMIVVTRNIIDFKSTGVEILNPWEPNH